MSCYNYLEMKEIKVKVIWDDEAKVWIATSDDVPGLVTESEDFDTLINKLRVIIPELIEENKLEFGRTGKIKFHIIGERTEILMV